MKTSNWEKELRDYFPLESLADGIVTEHGDYRKAKIESEVILNEIILKFHSTLSSYQKQLIRRLKEWILEPRVKDNEYVETYNMAIKKAIKIIKEGGE